MSNKLGTILSEISKQDFATSTGQKMHKKMQKITTDDVQLADDEILKKISKNTELYKFFDTNSKTEVPVAGYINGHFVSRRIDRLFIDEKAKQIYILDYKTDIDKDAFKNKYIIQIKEYISLLSDIYSGYKIRGFILWLSDFTLEEIV